MTPLDVRLADVPSNATAAQLLHKALEMSLARARSLPASGTVGIIVRNVGQWYVKLAEGTIIGGIQSNEVDASPRPDVVLHLDQAGLEMLVRDGRLSGSADIEGDPAVLRSLGAVLCGGV